MEKDVYFLTLPEPDPEGRRDKMAGEKTKYDKNKEYAKTYLKKYEDIKIRVEKDVNGEGKRDRQYYKDAAEARGYSSLNKFALEAMDEKIEREPVEEE